MFKSVAVLSIEFKGIFMCLHANPTLWEKVWNSFDMHN